MHGCPEGSEFDPRRGQASDFFSAGDTRDRAFTLVLVKRNESSQRQVCLADLGALPIAITNT